MHLLELAEVEGDERVAQRERVPDAVGREPGARRRRKFISVIKPVAPSLEHVERRGSIREIEHLGVFVLLLLHSHGAQHANFQIVLDELRVVV